jgi:hypothetical protein
MRKSFEANDLKGNVIPLRESLSPEDEYRLLSSVLRHPAAHFATSRLVERPVLMTESEPRL